MSLFDCALQLRVTTEDDINKKKHNKKSCFIVQSFDNTIANVQGNKETFIK